MRKWTDKEIQYVKRNWQKKTDAEMGKALNRSAGAVQEKRITLNLKRKRGGKGRVGDGRSKHPLYRTWHGIISRCYDKSSFSYRDYGGRGIGICNRWRGKSGFWNFVADMKWVGEKPSPKHELDRINNDFDYDPDNVRWVTHEENCNNTRMTNKITAFGETKGVSLWLKDARCDVDSVYELLSRCKYVQPEIAMSNDKWNKEWKSTCQVVFIGEKPSTT